MPKTKGAGELDPHLHEDERIRTIFRLFESCCEFNKCYELECPVRSECVDLFDTLMGWSVGQWERKTRIWQLRKKGLSFREISREVNLKERQVRTIIRQLDKLSAKYSNDGG